MADNEDMFTGLDEAPEHVVKADDIESKINGALGTSDANVGKVTETNFAEEMRSSFLEYSMSVIVARALPDVRDGLKPVHRRVLYAMHESGCNPSKPHVKSARPVGDCMGKYHPHGDAAIYDTLVRMAQDFSMRVPLVDGHGNFGSVDGDSPAAMRYTECRLDKPAMELLKDLEKETVDWQPNYDESLQEPKVLPARFPNLLVNGSAGIAVGMATNMPPHNMAEAIDATIAVIDNPDIDVDELMQIIPGPDFPTGGIIMGRSGIRDAYATGRGSLTIRSKCHIEKTDSGKQRIIVTEIPYQVNKLRLIEKIAELVKLKKITEISGLNDESDRKGMRIVIDVKRGEEPEVVLQKLYKHTQLQTGFGVINLALVDGVPHVLSLKEIIAHYIEHQKDVVTRRTRYELRKAEERAHILQGYIIALDNIDEVIQIIRNSRDDNEARAKLMERFGLSEPQTNAILEMRLRRLTGLERDKIETELADLMDKIAEYKKILSDVHEVERVIKEELEETKRRFADKRRTEITDSSSDVDLEDLIAEEDMVVTITEGGYIKRVPADTYQEQKRGGKGKTGVNLKDDDGVDQVLVASTHDFLLIFSNFGKVYRIKVHQVPLGSRQARGTALVNLVPFEKEERCATVINTRSFPEDEFLLFGTSHGMIKKTAFSQYKNVRSSGLIAINLKDGDELVSVHRFRPGSHIVMASSAGRAIKFDDSNIRAMGRDTSGVRGMKVDLDAGVRVLGMEVVPEGKDDDLLVITERGYGKRTKLSEYNLQGRGGQGVTTIKMTPRNGNLVAMMVVPDEHELIVMSQNGMTLRCKASDISELGRATQGVKIMNVTDDDCVTALARVIDTEGGKKASAAIAGQIQHLDTEVSGSFDTTTEHEEQEQEELDEE